MRRRDFIALAGGAATWPLAARAQQPDWVRHIGVLEVLAADDREGLDRVGAFVQGLQQLGWTDRRNVATPAGPPAMPSAFAGTRRNWSRSRRTSSWPRPPRSSVRCDERPAPYRSCSCCRRRHVIRVHLNCPAGSLAISASTFSKRRSSNSRKTPRRAWID
jgi:hypothetical protein